MKKHMLSIVIPLLLLVSSHARGAEAFASAAQSPEALLTSILVVASRLNNPEVEEQRKMLDERIPCVLAPIVACANAASDMQKNPLEFFNTRQIRCEELTKLGVPEFKPVYPNNASRSLGLDEWENQLFDHLSDYVDARYSTLLQESRTLNGLALTKTNQKTKERLQSMANQLETDLNDTVYLNARSIKEKRAQWSKYRPELKKMLPVMPQDLLHDDGDERKE